MLDYENDIILRFYFSDEVFSCSCYIGYDGFLFCIAEERMATCHEFEFIHIM